MIRQRAEWEPNLYIYILRNTDYCSGEMYSGEIIRYLKECMQNGLNALGVSEDKKQVSVIVEGWSSLEFKRLSLYDLF